jgi:hypothetical protein
MENALCRFHTFTDVFLIGQAVKIVKVKAHSLKMERMKKRKVDQEANAETWMPANKRREMNTCWDYISHEIHGSKELDSDVNFPNIHLMTHWAEQIRRYGVL